MNYAKIGTRIRAMRKALGLTQVQAADDAGVSARTWCDLERGMLTPNLGTLVYVAGVLGVNVSELVKAGE